MSATIIHDKAGDALPANLKQFYELCDLTRYHWGKYQQKDADGNPQPPTLVDLRNHFEGKPNSKGEQGKLSLYLKAKGAKVTRLVILDIDDHAGVGGDATKKLLSGILAATGALDLHPLISPSESGTGYHVGYWYEEPQDCAALLKQFHVVLTGRGLKKGKQKGDYLADNGLMVEVRGVTDKAIAAPFYNGAPCIDPHTLAPVAYDDYPWNASTPVLDHKVIQFKKLGDVFEAEYADLLTSGFDPNARNNDAHITAARLYADKTPHALALGIMKNKWEQTVGHDTFLWGECLGCLKSAYTSETDTKSIEKEGLAIVPITETLQKDIAPIEWVVEDVLPKGYAMLVGKPKKGKSFLALDLAINVAGGTPFLEDYETTKQDVLYLALEDGERRIKQRVEGMKLDVIPAGLLFSYYAPDIDNGLIDQIRAVSEQRPHLGLVIIDTLAKVWPVTKSSGGVYHAEYKMTDKLKQLANDTGCTILVIHHENKNGSDDSVEAVSGSNGIAGTADTIMRLIRTEGQNDACLKIISRDVGADQSIGIIHDTDGFKTHTASDVITSKQELRVFNYLREHGPHTPASVALALDMKGAVRNYLKRLLASGHVEKFTEGEHKGKYRAIYEEKL